LASIRATDHYIEKMRALENKNIVEVVVHRISPWDDGPFVTWV
jgi:hypothetical protein